MPHRFPPSNERGVSSAEFALVMPAFFLVAMAPSLIGLIKSFRSLVQ